ncbi:MAG TPA: T9SS type A sorting domain-containing protein [Saprospiraceae bacterium]|nr:T9SS type A sorting domain-containing protein [Saprospiraceae bacterium]
MKFSQLLVLGFAILLQPGNALGQSSNFHFSFDTATAAPNQVVCLNLKVHDFYKIVSFQMILGWDKNVVDFDHVENLQLPGWSSLDFLHLNNHCLFMGWADPPGIGVTKPDGDTIASICFKVIPMPGNSTDISLASGCGQPGSGGNEAYNAYAQNVWNSSLFVNGHIIIIPSNAAANIPEGRNLDFQLQPNPSTASTTLFMESPEAGNGAIRVSNLTGQLLWTQRINYQSGQNQFQIPEEAIANAGLFLVTLETEGGSATRLLSVY